MQRSLAALGLAVLGLSAAPAAAVVTPFEGDLAGFNATGGTPPITINFEGLVGQNLAGQTVSGVTFSSPTGNSLDVVIAANTVSAVGGANNTLPSTSGTDILSPGGTNLAGGPDLRQRDDLELVFSSPVSAFGLDVLFEALDGAAFFGYTAYGPDGITVVASNGSVAIPATNGAGAFFIGLVSDSASTNISRIVFADNDDNSINADANVGYDTFRFAIADNAVPEPGTWMMLILGFGVLGSALRLGRRSPGPTAA